MSSTTAAMGSTPSEGSSPFVSDSWGLRLFGPEDYPPFVGDGEFAIINPDFWGASKEEQESMKGWYVFHAVSSFPFKCYSYADDVLIQWIESINRNVDPKPRWLVVASHNDQYHLWRDAHRENLLQWRAINPLRDSVRILEEGMAAMHLKEEEVKAQMAALEEKTRELEFRLQEVKDFSVRLSRLVVWVIEGFLQQAQELSFIKFILTAVLLGSGGDVSGASNGPDVPPGGPGSGGPPSVTTSAVSRWLESSFRNASSPPSSPIGPPTLNSEILFGEGNSFWTALSPLSSLGEIEEGRHSGFLGVGGRAGDNGGFQGIGGGIGLVPDNSIPQFS